MLYKKNEHIRVQAYTDADYVGNVDDKKSISRFCNYVGGNLITWKARNKMWFLGLV